MTKKWLVVVMLVGFSCFLGLFGNELLERDEQDKQIALKARERDIQCQAVTPGCGYYEELGVWEYAVLRYSFFLPLVGLLVYECINVVQKKKNKEKKEKGGTRL